MITAIAARLGAHIKRRRAGVLTIGAGFLLEEAPDTVREADIALVRQERIAGQPIPTKFFPGPPDLAVEVMSPSDTIEQVDEKVQDWLEHGAEAVWVVSPRWKTISIYARSGLQRTLKAGDTLEDPVLLPGFGCQVGELFDFG